MMTTESNPMTRQQAIQHFFPSIGDDILLLFIRVTEEAECKVVAGRVLEIKDGSYHTVTLFSCFANEREAVYIALTDYLIYKIAP